MMDNKKKSQRPKLIALFDTIVHLTKQVPPDIAQLKFIGKDFKITRSFLLQYKGSSATFESYRRELERLLQWAWRIEEKSILKLKREDIESYIAFCKKPPKAWIGTKRVSRFITKNGERVPNPEWRLFLTTLTKSEAKQGALPQKNQFTLSEQTLSGIFVILGSFYNYLLNENLVKANPIAQIRQKSQYIRKQQGGRKVRRLTELQWNFVIETAQLMAKENPAVHERTLFIMTMLYLLYLRVSELVSSPRWTPLMGHFYQDSQENWWFKTVGKGNKARDITVPNAMLKALRHYRKNRGLSPALPLPNEQTPLILTHKGNKPISSDRQIRRIVQSCFDTAIERMIDEGFTDEANQLQEATVHWLRHTGISDDINKRGRPVAHVRDDAGHSSSAITDRYNDSELQARHRSARNKKVDE